MGFRKWLYAEEKADARLQRFIDDQEITMFFKADSSYFGACEGARIIFAQMKNPPEDLPSNWEKTASFHAYNLEKAIEHEIVEEVFDMKRIKKIQIVDREEMLAKVGSKDAKGGSLVFYDPEKK